MKKHSIRRAILLAFFCIGISINSTVYGSTTAALHPSSETIGSQVLENTLGQEKPHIPDEIEMMAAQGGVQVIINLRESATAPDATQLQTLQAIRDTQSQVVRSLSTTNFQLSRRFSRLPVIVGTITEEGLAALRNNPLVVSVTPDYPMVAHVQDGIVAVGANQVHAGTMPGIPSITGIDTVVAVMDTGIDDHPDLAGKIIEDACFTVPGCSVGDTDGHGTHVAGIIAAYAPGAELVNLKVLESVDSGHTSDWLEGLEWLLNNHETKSIKVVNMSLGTQALFSAQCDVEFAGAATAIRTLREQGVTLISSTGNDFDSGAIAAPACLADILAVAAVYDSGDDIDSAVCPEDAASLNPDTITCFSNTNWMTDIAAPGADIRSTFLNGDYQSYAGTSQASPAVAGTIALMLEANVNLLPAKIQSILQGTGVSAYKTNSQVPLPRLNASEAVKSAFETEFDCADVTQIPETECNALRQLYALQDPIEPWETNEGWELTYTPCDWFGIVCPDNHITGIRLTKNNLVGPLDAVKWDAFPALVELRLASNKLSGPIPDALAKLENLSVLELGYNRLDIWQNTEGSLIADQRDPSWSQTQTIYPINVGSFLSSTTQFSIMFSPIPYQEDGGYYEAACRTSPGEDPFTGRTNDKKGAIISFAGVQLQPNTTYYCTVRTYTELGLLWSEPSAEIKIVTDPNAVGRNPKWTLTPTADTTVSSNRSAPIYMGNFRGLIVGSYTDYTVNPPLAFNRSVALIDFIDPIPVPPGARVKKISLRVFYYGTNGKPVNVEVYRVGQHWDETSSISHPPKLLGRSGSSTAYGSKNFPVVGNVGLNPPSIDIDLHPDLIHDLTLINHGLALRSNPPNTLGLVMCAGRYTENLGSKLCSNTPPQLTIEYELRPELVNPFPADDAIDQPLTVPLSWEVRPDGSGNTMRYEVLVRSSKETAFTSKISNLRQPQYELTLPQPGEYFWRVDIRLGNGLVVTGQEWSFHTNYCPGNAYVDETQCDALRALYNSTTGLEATTWLKKQEICDWGEPNDIVCNENGSVTSINLSGQFQGGQLPPEIGSFPDLKRLILRRNNPDGGLGGHIPKEIEFLTNLVELDLHGHQFTGSIPDEITNLTLAEHVDLSSNDLTGIIPDNIGDMEALTYLNLSDNRLSEAIAPSIGDLKFLNYLNLSRNRLDGKIPAKLGDAANLTELYLEYNRIVGVIPPKITNLKLDKLNLTYNRLRAENAAVNTFVNGLNPGWKKTQTVPPINFKIMDNGKNHVTLGWDYNGDTANPGVFQVLCGEREGGPYLDRAQTPDKLTNSLVIDKLFPGGTYYCMAITHTLEHTEQKSAMWSEASEKIEVTTKGSGLVGEDPIPLNWDGETPYIRFLDLTGAPTNPAIGSKCGTGGGGRAILSKGHSGKLKLRVKTESENIATTLAVYKGKFPNGLTEIDCNENADTLTGPDPATSTELALPQVDFNPQWRAIVDFEVNLAQGENLYIVIFNRNGGDGLVKLTVQDASFTTCDKVSKMRPDDCESLVDLYYATQGYRWYNNTGWLLSNTPCASWFGVTCNANGRVTGLSLPYNNLDGQIPASIGNLTRLKKLLLNNNRLRGSVPDSIRKLTQLNELRLGFNALTAVGTALIDFLNDVSPRWDLTQTIAPPNVQAQCLSRNSVRLSWGDIKYVDADGYYEIAYSESPGGPYEVVRYTADRNTNEAIFDISPGTPYYFVMRTFTDDEDERVDKLWSNPGREVALSPTCEDTVMRLVLIDPTDDHPIRTLRNGDIIDLSLFTNREINIRADVNFTTIGSVVFDLNQGWEKTTDNTAPYALFGDNAGDFNGRDLGPGVYTLTAQPFTLPGGQGEAGIPKTIRFILTDGDRLYRVNTGGPRVVTDGKVWDADKHYLDGYEWPHPTVVDIAETTEDAPYLTKRSTDTDFGAFSYEFPVPNGSYDVILHFAEIYFTGEAGQGNAQAGERVFDVSIEGQLVLDDFDMLALKPPLTAITRLFEDVVVTDGVLNIQFHDPIADRPSVSAIEIVIPDKVVEVDPSIPTPTPTPDRPNVLIYNGGFELPTAANDQNNPAYWEMEVSRFSRRVCNNNQHSGNCALRMRSESGTPTVVIQRNDNIDPTFQNVGDQVVFSVWVRGQNLKADVQMVARLTYASGATESIELDTSGLSGTLTQYQELTASTTLIEPIEKVRVRLVVRQGTGSLFVDDVKLELKPPSVLPAESDGLRGIRIPGQ